MFRFELKSCCLKPLKDIECCTTRPKRRILKRNRRAKHSHDAVAGEASNETTLLTHCLVHQLRQATN
jgi:hypothetical protein